jgi:outer membrane receptor protein involved in Fe transport
MCLSSERTNIRLSTFKDFRYATNTGLSPGIFGRSTFSNRFTGRPYADFILGYPTTLERSFPAVPIGTERWSLGFYATDSWKPTPNLTLILGLRWEAQMPWRETSGRMAAFDIESGRIVVPDGSLDLASPLMPRGYVDIVEASAAGFPSKLVRADMNNFQPRFGVAWAALRPQHGVPRRFRVRV